MCGASVQQIGRKWSYSFEAECLRFGVPYRNQDPDDDPPAYSEGLPEGLQICPGVSHDSCTTLHHDQPSQQSPKAVLAILQYLQDVISARPGFAELYARATDKRAFVEEVMPFMYIGSEGKARSSFCCVILDKDTGITACTACKKTQEYVDELMQQEGSSMVQDEHLPDVKRSKLT